MNLMSLAMARTERDRNMDSGFAKAPFATRIIVNGQFDFAPYFFILGRELSFQQENELALCEKSGGQYSFCLSVVNQRKLLGRL